ncbi:polyketide synthase [Streptomyces sp. NPDC012888]|uniref:beta-ketoacyl [acyl carrier protein] synthase domain-containing protein n=1 Tax=Streptomyces sp. NPDC012888 TaxID=3364855 RepID=UPI0036B043E0
MDQKEVLTRFKNGRLDRGQVAALLTGTAPGPAPAPAPLPAPGPPGAPRALPAGAAPAAAPDRTAEPVAVVGMAGRYPGAAGLAAFWQRVRDGHGTAAAPPRGRPGGEPGHYLERVQDFDAEFFGMDPADAALTDPQERLFLETAWEALEDAGCTGGRLDALTAGDGTPRSVGVFAAAGTGDYRLLAAASWTRGQPRPMPPAGHWSLPNRLSSLLGLTGPSQSVDTAESSVLVALHLAVAALRRGECAAALVGGVQLLLHPSSRRPGAGEGVGVLLLKPLSRALADGDTVYCTVLGTAVGHAPAPAAGPGHRRPPAGPGPGTDSGRRPGPDSGSESGSDCGCNCGSGTGSGGDADAGAHGHRVLRAALRDAGVDAAAVTVREDAGSVRTLVGAAGPAGGAAALTRAVLQLRHRVLAPGPGRAAAEAWGTTAGAPPRRAAVGIRGAGGTDAHAVLEEYPPTPEPGPTTPPGPAPQLFLLSAPTPAHLAATVRRFTGLLAGPGPAPAPALDALARALRTGRAAMDCRFAAVVEDAGQLLRVLEEFLRDGAPHADLRDGGADPLGLAGVPETDAYLAALWRAGHLHRLRALWLSGVDVDWAALEGTAGAGAVSVPLPPSAFLRTPLWLGGAEDPA